MIYEDLLPNAIAIGIPVKTFWHLTMKELDACFKAFNMQEKKKDEYMWRMGIYVRTALMSSVCNAFLWKKKGAKPDEYPQKPYSYDDSYGNNSDYDGSEMSEEEKQKKIDLLFAQLNIMAANYNATHPKKEVSNGNNDTNQ